MLSTTSVSPNPTPVAAGVYGSVEFIRPIPGQKPSFESSALAGSRTQQQNFETERKQVYIEDVRAWPIAPRLDREGFALLKHPTANPYLYDDSWVQQTYLPEVEQLITHVLGAKRVISFDVTRRSDKPGGANNPDGARKPASRIHVDYTHDSGPKRAGDVLGIEVLQAAIDAGHPVVQINAWRPITGPVRRSPLAFVDASTIRPTALIATDQVFADRIGEIYHLAYEPGQRFGYISDFRTDEVVLIKGWDSREDGRARFTPHTAFALPHQAQAPARESIEVRTFAILDET